MNKRNKRPHGIGIAHRDPQAWITETRGVAGVLASLWRRIQFDLGIGGNKFEILLADFIAKSKRGIPSHRVSRHFTRGNVRRELEKDTMTFKVFVKALRLIKIKHVRLAVELTHQSGRKTLHGTEIDLGNEDFHDNDDDTGENEKDE